MDPILQPLSVVYRLGVGIRHAAYRRGWLKTRRLTRPVVSVGNLTVGGTGKTPLVAFLARALLKRGWTPGILTRGYGRRRGADLLALAPDAQRAPKALEVGDEPAWLAQALPEVPIVICADRYRAGQLAEERFHVGVHLLDDGFQHRALARDVDVVVLDVTQEFSDRALLPAGRLREPCAALGRAQIVVISRVELGDPGPLDEAVIRINPHARVFHSTTTLGGVTDVETRRVHPLEELRGKGVAAFCGIGNPQAFFADLGAWGFNVVSREAFPDHHVYTEEELSRVSKRARAAGAAALLITEKDALNFPPRWASVLPVLACAIQTAVAESGGFEAALLERL